MKLREITKKLTASRKDNLAWHLQALVDLVPIRNDWKHWRKEAGGISFDAWLRSWRGPTKRMLARYEQARAMWDGKPGPVATYLGDAGALIWLRNVSPSQAPGVQQELVKAWREIKRETGCEAPLPPRAVGRVIHDCLGSTRKPRGCQQCAKYRARIAELEAALALQRAAE